MTRLKTFDLNCFFMAENLLNREADVQALRTEHAERLKEALAGDIQGAIEDFIGNLKEEIRLAANKETDREPQNQDGEEDDFNVGTYIDQD